MTLTRLNTRALQDIKYALLIYECGKTNHGENKLVKVRADPEKRKSNVTNNSNKTTKGIQILANGGHRV